MYNAFFELDVDPFGRACNRALFFNSKQHLGSLKSLEFGVRARMGLMSLTGGDGSGKTTVLEALRESLEASHFACSYLRDSRLSVERFFETVAADIAPSCKDASVFRIFTGLHQVMRQQSSKGRTVVLLVDEAQHLNADVRKEILQFANLEDPRGKLLQIVLAGPAELDSNMEAWDLGRLNQSNLLSCRLQPFTLEETREYIDFRMERAGVPRQTIFPPCVTEEIHWATNGNPGAINLVCQRLMLAAFSLGVKECNDEVLVQVLTRRHRNRVQKPARVVETRSSRTALLLPASVPDNVPAMSGRLRLGLSQRSMPWVPNPCVELNPFQIAPTHSLAFAASVAGGEPAVAVLLRPTLTCTEAGTDCRSGPVWASLEGTLEFPTSSLRWRTTLPAAGSIRTSLRLGEKNLVRPEASHWKFRLDLVWPRAVLAPEPKSPTPGGRIKAYPGSPRTSRNSVQATTEAAGLLRSLSPSWPVWERAPLAVKLGPPLSHPVRARSSMAEARVFATAAADFPVVASGHFAITDGPQTIPPMQSSLLTIPVTPAASPGHRAPDVNGFYPPRLVAEVAQWHVIPGQTLPGQAAAVAIGIASAALGPEPARGRIEFDSFRPLLRALCPESGVQPIGRTLIPPQPSFHQPLLGTASQFRIPVRTAGITILMALLLVLLPKAGTAAWRAGRELRHAVIERAAVAREENFRSGFGDWTARGDKDAATSWRVDAAGFAQPGSLKLYRPSLALADYQLEFVGTIRTKSLSWVVRAADFDNYYAVKLEVTKPGPLPTVSIIRYAVINGKAQSRVVTPLALSVRSDTVYRIRMDLQGETFSLSVQDRPVDSWTEPRLRHGAVGFFSDRDAESRVAGVQVRGQYDMLGRLCAYFAAPASNND